jgi:hypothetical protein
MTQADGRVLRLCNRVYNTTSFEFDTALWPFPLPFPLLATSSVFVLLYIFIHSTFPSKPSNRQQNSDCGHEPRPQNTARAMDRKIENKKDTGRCSEARQDSQSKLTHQKPIPPAQSMSSSTSSPPSNCPHNDGLVKCKQIFRLSDKNVVSKESDDAETRRPENQSSTPPGPHRGMCQYFDKMIGFALPVWYRQYMYIVS